MLRKRLSGFVSPEYGVDSEFAHFVNEYYKVITKNLTKRLVSHRYIGLAPQTVVEFAFHHADRRFDVASLVVTMQEFSLSELKVAIHLGLGSAMRFSQVTHEAALRNGQLNYEYDIEDYTGHQQSRAPGIWLSPNKSGAAL